MAQPKRIIRQIRSYARGIDSYVDPLLLPRNQLSYAVNATMRGNFITQRPSLFRYSLVDTNSGVDLAAFQTALYQGSAYYRNGNNGYIMAAVNGSLFQILPNTTTQVATITKIALPSQNSTTAVKNWLWQAESFLIWSDGINLPFFWNGSTARRSLGSALTILGITNADFDAPTQGQYVPGGVPLVSAYSGNLGTVLIAGAQYNIVGKTSAVMGSTSTLFLDQVSGSGSPSDYIQPGTGVYTSSQYAGIILATDQAPAVFPPVPTAGQAGSSATVTVLSPNPPASGNVPLGTVVSDSPQYCGVITNSTVANFPSGGTAFVTVTVTAANAGSAISNNESIEFHNAATTLVYQGFCNSVVLSGGVYTFNVPANQSTGATVQSTDYILRPNVGFGRINTYGINVSKYPSTGLTQFTLTFSKSFGGKVGDVLSIPVTGQTFQTVSPKVVSISGTQVTCTMPSSFTTAGVTVPVNNSTLVQNQTTTTPVIVYGTTFSTSPAVGSAIPIVFNTTGATINPATGLPYLVAQGQTLYFTATVSGGGTQVIVGVILTAPSNGTYGNASNFFTLTLSQPFVGNQGDVLQVGASGSPARFLISQIISASAGVVQCQMINTPLSGTIPIGSPTTATTSNIVINNTQSSAPVLTLVGTYPTGSTRVTTAGLPIAGLLTQTASTRAQVDFLVQIAVTDVNGTTTSGSPDLFIVQSVTNGGLLGQNSVSLYSLNDTAGRQIPSGTPIYSLPELPQCRMGAYGMGRNWVAVTDGTSCNSFVAGDTVGSSSGTPPNREDAVLKVSQNYFLANGLTFQISGAGEEIVGLAFLAQLNVALGQGPLNIFTDDSVINCQAPTDATTWANLSSPIITVGLIGSGGIGQDSVVQENADLIFRKSDGGVQSVQTATIGFQQWGNTPISNEIIRAIQDDPVELLPFCSMDVYDNRLLVSCQFSQMARGVVGRAISVLNFDSISTLQGKQPSIWEGEWDGLNVLSIITGFFSGSQQCFALCFSDDGSQIELSQINLDKTATVDNGNAPIVWQFETGMIFDPQSETLESRSYKRLINGEISLSKISSDVTIQSYYRPDQWGGWVPWAQTNVKYAGPADPGFRSRIGLGQPSPSLMDATNNRPLREAYDFQMKFVVMGACQFSAGRFMADEIDEPEFAKPV